MSTSANHIARIVESVHLSADAFASASDPLFLSLDAGKPVEPPKMVPPIRQAIANMRHVLDEAENLCNAIEK